MKQEQRKGAVLAVQPARVGEGTSRPVGAGRAAAAAGSAAAAAGSERRQRQQQQGLGLNSPWHHRRRRRRRKSLCLKTIKKKKALSLRLACVSVVVVVVVGSRLVDFVGMLLHGGKNFVASYRKHLRCQSEGGDDDSFCHPRCSYRTPPPPSSFILNSHTPLS